MICTMYCSHSYSAYNSEVQDSIDNYIKMVDKWIKGESITTIDDANNALLKAGKRISNNLTNQEQRHNDLINQNNQLEQHFAIVD